MSTLVFDMERLGTKRAEKYKRSVASMGVQSWPKFLEWATALEQWERFVSAVLDQVVTGRVGRLRALAKEYVMAKRRTKR